MDRSKANEDQSMPREAKAPVEKGYVEPDLPERVRDSKVRL